MKILIIGHACHGKDTVAELLSEYSALSFESSSKAAISNPATGIFQSVGIPNGYRSWQELYEHRGKHRAELFEAIGRFNKHDPAALAKLILSDHDIYVGMRSQREFLACWQAELFDMVLGVYRPGYPEESKDSFDIDFWGACDVVIPNAGLLEDLEDKVMGFVGYIESIAIDWTHELE